MNILLMIWDQDELRYALVPAAMLRGYNYRAWDGVYLGQDRVTPRVRGIDIGEEIEDVFKRLGLEEGLPKRQQDLRRFLHKSPPFAQIDFVVKFGWIDQPELV